MNLFISYAREDREKVSKIVSQLEPYSDCWVDWDDIPPGSNWKAAIRQGIFRCDYFLFFVSHHALKSKWCLRELRWALWLKKPIMPIAFDSSVQVPHVLSTRQWIVLDSNLGIKTILAGLAARSHFPWRFVAIVEGLVFAIAFLLFK